MNTPAPTCDKDKTAELRQIIRDARARKGMTEDEVNAKYHELMKERGIDAPTAIMTKVRDKRRELVFSKKGAQCLAQLLSLDPQDLYPEPSPQAQLNIIDEEDDPIEQASAGAKEKAHDANEAITQHQPERKRPAPSAGIADIAAGKPATATEHSRKVSAGFYETEKGLQFLINMELTPRQFDRLALAIPPYMMHIENRGERIYTRAQVPIFPYQAELLMRAIYGGI